MNGRVIEREVEWFTGFIESYGLREFELQNVSYTHKSTRGPWSRLDRFLVSPEWSEIFGGCHESAGSLGGSDHKIVMLEGEAQVGGPRPFRFKRYWLQHGDTVKMMEGWWCEYTVTSNASTNSARNSYT